MTEFIKEVQMKTISALVTTEKLIGFLLLIGKKIVSIAIILIVCTIAIKITNHLVRKFFNSKIGSSKLMDTRAADTMNSIVSSLLKYLYYFIAIWCILVQIGVTPASLLPVAGVGSVALGFGSQKLVQDIIAGFFILLEDQYGVGDIVSIEGHTGTVEEISIRTTKVRCFDGTLMIIPNGSVGIVTNMCKEYMNAIVNIDIDYKEDIEHVLKILNDEVEKASKLLDGLRSNPTVLGIVALTESAVTIRITAECEIKENYKIERELKRMVKNRLDEEQIKIPFPQRTIHVVTEEKPQAKGGE